MTRLINTAISAGYTIHFVCTTLSVKAVDEEQYTVVTPSVKMKALENADQFVTTYLSKNYNIIINQLYDQNELLGKWGVYMNEQVLMNTLTSIDKDTDNMCPEIDKVFRAFHLTDPSRTRLVIVGQDPYPQKE